MKVAFRPGYKLEGEIVALGAEISPIVGHREKWDLTLI